MKWSGKSRRSSVTSVSRRSGVIKSCEIGRHSKAIKIYRLVLWPMISLVVQTFILVTLARKIDEVLNVCLISIFRPTPVQKQT